MDDGINVTPEQLNARSGDPETSHAAMAAYDPSKMSDAVRAVIAVYEHHGPLADFELEPLFEDTYRTPHCRHLYRQARSIARDAGRIRDTGTRKINPATRRRQVVWEACTVEPPDIPRCPMCGKVMRGGLDG